MKIVSEFKSFAVKGNAIDMAVGIIIGAAFGKIVSSLVGDILMPPLGVMLGGMDFSALSVTIKHATETTSAVVIGYGKFIQTIIDFVIIAFSIFMLVRVLSKMQKKKDDTPAAPTTAPSKEEILLTEIRDIMKDMKK